MAQISSLHRALGILKKLNNGEKIRIENLSYEYDVTERTIRRDLNLIKTIYPNFMLKSGEDYYAIEKNILNNVLSGTDLATLISVLEVFKSSGSKFVIDKKLKSLYKNSTNIYNLNIKPFEELSDRKIISNVEKSIEYKQIINIEYKKFDKIQNIKVKPYKIVLLNENFYLASEILIKEEYKFTLLRIGLIKEIILQQKTFYPNPQLLNFINTIQTPWAKFNPNKSNIEVEVYIPKNISRYFQMKKYLPSQKIIHQNENGSLIIHYSVSDLSEIKETIIKWLPNIKINYPQELKNLILQEMKHKMKYL